MLASDACNLRGQFLMPMRKLYGPALAQSVEDVLFHAYNNRWREVNAAIKGGFNVNAQSKEGWVPGTGSCTVGPRPCY